MRTGKVPPKKRNQKASGKKSKKESASQSNDENSSDLINDTSKVSKSSRSTAKGQKLGKSSVVGAKRPNQKKNNVDDVTSTKRKKGTPQSEQENQESVPHEYGGTVEGSQKLEEPQGEDDDEMKDAKMEPHQSDEGEDLVADECLDLSKKKSISNTQ